MIRHLLKMVWNRKRINGLLMIEIFISFLVLFVVLGAATLYVSNYRSPLGYATDNVWRIYVDTRLPGKGHIRERLAGLNALKLAMRDLPEIGSVGWMEAGPYSHSTSIHGTKYNGVHVEAEVNAASDEMVDVLKIPLTAGRWFSHEDDGSKFTPIVINETFAQTLFGSESPLGKRGTDSSERIVGVIRDFRKAGEFSSTVNYQISRDNLDDTTRNPWGAFHIRVREGTTAEFQERLIRVLESVRKGWSFTISTLAQDRESDFKERLTPLIAGAVVAVFLLLMVALGLIGVLWQNVSQRRKEMGLRRAVGATAISVSRQIHGEQFVITTLGVAAASFLVLQLPLLDLIGFITPGVYLFALVLSLGLTYAITYVCSVFPGWLAMAVEPAEALHYE